MNQKIAFIGGGRMATALIGGIITNRFERTNIYVYDSSKEQCRLLKEQFGVNTTSISEEVPKNCSTVLWAVKPQSLRVAAKPFQASFESCLHISIVAGVRIRSLQEVFNSRRVIRAMPNTPALIGTGVTALLPGVEVTDPDKSLAENILKPTGFSFWVENDERMDAVTALTGSGPGYVFHFIEGLIKAAEAVGFNNSEARNLALLTVQGSVTQAIGTEDSISSLRQAVTSPGGTTEAGLSVMSQWRVQDAMVATLQSAYSRAIELGQEYELPNLRAD